MASAILAKQLFLAHLGEVLRQNPMKVSVAEDIKYFAARRGTGTKLFMAVAGQDGMPYP